MSIGGGPGAWKFSVFPEKAIVLYEMDRKKRNITVESSP
jgi:hypothetical protein